MNAPYAISGQSLDSEGTVRPWIGFAYETRQNLYEVRLYQPNNVIVWLVNGREASPKDTKVTRLLWSAFWDKEIAQ